MTLYSRLGDKMSAYYTGTKTDAETTLRYGAGGIPRNIDYHFETGILRRLHHDLKSSFGFLRFGERNVFSCLGLQLKPWHVSTPSTSEK